MFATLLGPLPRPPLAPDAAVVDLVRAAVEAQVAAGLEPVTDGGLRHARSIDVLAGLAGLRTTTDGNLEAFAEPAWREPLTAGDWRETAGLTGRAVKQVLLGPYSAALAIARGAIDRETLTLALAGALNAELRALAAAGCPLVEVHEPAIAASGTEADWELFAEAERRLLDGVDGIHVSLAITGGSPDPAGIPVIAAAPFASLAVDLIAGPDNWRLVTAIPGARGVVAGALSTASGSDDGPELLLWALGYAASTNGRGAGRVGLATASGLERLAWTDALAKMDRLAEAVELAALERTERAERIDPRAIDLRSAAAGRFRPTPSKGGPGGPAGDTDDGPARGR
jgi:methionine synthase II (cobalamin-independent)